MQPHMFRNSIIEGNYRMDIAFSHFNAPLLSYESKVLCWLLRHKVSEYRKCDFSEQRKASLKYNSLQFSDYIIHRRLVLQDIKGKKNFKMV